MWGEERDIAGTRCVCVCVCVCVRGAWREDKVTHTHIHKENRG